MKPETELQTQVLGRLNQVSATFSLGQFYRRSYLAPFAGTGLWLNIDDKFKVDKVRRVLDLCGVRSTVAPRRDLRDERYLEGKYLLIVEKKDYPQVTEEFLAKALKKINVIVHPNKRQQESLRRLSRISNALGLGNFEFEWRYYNSCAAVRAENSERKNALVTAISRKESIAWQDDYGVVVSASHFPKITDSFVKKTLQSLSLG